MELLPIRVGALENPAGKSVHKLIGKNVGAPAELIQSGRKTLVPCDTPASQEFFLFLAERGGNFDNVVAKAEAFPPPEGG
jgi:hypothetical protein